MKHSRLLPIGALVLATAMVAVGCAPQADEGTDVPGSSSSPFEAMDPVVIKFSDPNPETATSVQALQAWMTEVTEATDGKVTFEGYYGGALHPGSEAVTAIESGLTDITFVSLSAHAQTLPTAAWVASAAASQGAEYPTGALAGNGAYFGVWETNEDVRADYAAHNAQPFVTWSSPGFDLLCSSPVDSLENAAGKLSRTTGSPFMEELASIGVAPVYLENGDLYEAMQRGVIDCVAAGAPTFITSSLAETAKYYTPVSMSPQGGSGYVIRKDLWDSLPEAVQDVMNEAKAAFFADFMRSTFERYASWVDVMEAEGVETVSGTELNGPIEATQEEALKNLAAKAPASVTDPDAVLSQLDEQMTVWRDILDEIGVEGDIRTPENLVDLFQGGANLDWDAYRDAMREYIRGL